MFQKNPLTGRKGKNNFYDKHEKSSTRLETKKNLKKNCRFGERK